ncbi:MAG: lysozyme inhibitor LprI family protein [Oryzomonas sp.]|uniref:lysozyme inhibitor LprI family protein n=1 Tax=Oryzomonas sp. TaxID=2855186 RepID=UPI00283C632A|nr:lysozyme inhibitor LprI family protein [Oryzomonas sp.]MDR3578871.1 lysozyme inhibitor LprI family protein [Oryzomonas sp.]
MRKLTITVCLAITLLSVVSGHAAQDTEIAAIDAAYSACLDKSEGVTATMNDCSGDAIGKMDNRLNQLYKTLMGKLAKPKQELLKNSQRKWLAWRTAEQDLSYALDPNEGGTLQGISANGFAYEMLKRRVQELEVYLSNQEI